MINGTDHKRGTKGSLSDNSSRHKIIIKLESVSKEYDSGDRVVKALDDFDMDIRSNDFVVVCGPSGCGKSTLLNVIIGAEHQNSGSVIIRDTDISSMSEDQRGVFRSKKMGVIYQRSYWVRSLNSLQNVALPLIIEGVSEKHAMNMAAEHLSELGLTHLAKQNPAKLSGGEQQKIAFARALITDPFIIVADEPTGNMDSTSADELMKMFSDLHKDKRKTIILVTHNQDYWSMGTRRIEMQDGKIIKEVIHG